MQPSIFMVYQLLGIQEKGNEFHWSLITICVNDFDQVKRINHLKIGLNFKFSSCCSQKKKKKKYFYTNFTGFSPHQHRKRCEQLFEGKESKIFATTRSEYRKEGCDWVLFGMGPTCFELADWLLLLLLLLLPLPLPADDMDRFSLSLLGVAEYAVSLLYPSSLTDFTFFLTLLISVLWFGNWDHTQSYTHNYEDF